jgi:hypothetical protein
MNFQRVLDHEAAFVFWKPKEIGETILGILSSITMNQNGRILQITKEDGSIQSVAISTVLENVKWDGLIGKTVKIVFQGTEVSKTGRTYMTFDVDVEA